MPKAASFYQGPSDFGKLIGHEARYHAQTNHKGLIFFSALPCCFCGRSPGTMDARRFASDLL